VFPGVACRFWLFRGVWEKLWESRGLAIKSGDKRARALPSRSSRTSRGSVVHNQPDGVRLRESTGSIQLPGDPRDAALQQLLTVAKQRIGTKRVTLLGTGRAQETTGGTGSRARLGNCSRASALAQCARIAIGSCKTHRQCSDDRVGPRHKRNLHTAFARRLALRWHAV